MLKRTSLLRQWRIGPLQSHQTAIQSRPPRPGCPIASSRCVPRRRSYASVSAAELQFGQPLHETHPHLLGPGERVYIYLTRWRGSFQLMALLTLETVTPGITAHEYAHRRSKLANRLPKNAIAVLAAADIKYKAPGIFYEYHQDSDFFYLTGAKVTCWMERRHGSPEDRRFHGAGCIGHNW
jgi:intermediate cleaving peptidase 55